MRRWWMSWMIWDDTELDQGTRASIMLHASWNSRQRGGESSVWHRLLLQWLRFSGTLEKLCFSRALCLLDLPLGSRRTPKKRNGGLIVLLSMFWWKRGFKKETEIPSIKEVKVSSWGIVLCLCLLLSSVIWISEKALFLAFIIALDAAWFLKVERP